RATVALLAVVRPRAHLAGPARRLLLLCGLVHGCPPRLASLNCRPLPVTAALTHTGGGKRGGSRTRGFLPAISMILGQTDRHLRINDPRSCSLSVSGVRKLPRRPHPEDPEARSSAPGARSSAPVRPSAAASGAVPSSPGGSSRE